MNGPLPIGLCRRLFSQGLAAAHPDLVERRGRRVGVLGLAQVDEGRAGGHLLGSGGKAVAQPRRGDAGGRKVLLIIEGDDLGAPSGLQIALEIGWHVDGPDGLARADRARRR